MVRGLSRGSDEPAESLKRTEKMGKMGENEKKRKKKKPNAALRLNVTSRALRHSGVVAASHSLGTGTHPREKEMSSGVLPQLFPEHFSALATHAPNPPNTVRY